MGSDAKLRAAVHREVVKQFREHLLIFVDGAGTQSLWYWVKRHDGKSHPRDHLYLYDLKAGGQARELQGHYRWATAARHSRWRTSTTTTLTNEDTWWWIERRC